MFYTPTPRVNTFIFKMINPETITSTYVKNTETLNTFKNATEDALAFYEEIKGLVKTNLSYVEKEIAEIKEIKEKINAAALIITKHLDKAIKDCPDSLRFYFNIGPLSINSYTKPHSEELTLNQLEAEKASYEERIKDLDLKIKIVNHNIAEVERIFG